MRRILLFVILIIPLLLACSGGHVTRQDGTSGFVQRNSSVGPSPTPQPAPPPVQETLLRRGEFVSDTHRGQGTAAILQSPNSTVLVLRKFGVEASPGLMLYLATDATAKDVVSLGPLRSYAGDTTYALPTGIDTARYSYVLIKSSDGALYTHAKMNE